MSPRVPVFVSVPSSGGGRLTPGAPAVRAAVSSPSPRAPLDAAGRGPGPAPAASAGLPRVPHPAGPGHGRPAAAPPSPSAEPPGAARAGGRGRAVPSVPSPSHRPPPAPRPRPIAARTKSRGALRVAGVYPGAGDARLRQLAVRWFCVLPNISTASLPQLP